MPTEAEAAEAAQVCDVQNGALAALTAAHPGRVSAVGAVVLQDPALAARQLHELITGTGLAGVEIPASVAGRYLGDDFFLPFWEAAADSRGAGVHPPHHPRLRRAPPSTTTTCGTRWGTRWRPRSPPRTWPWPGCSTGSPGCACCWPTAAARCRWFAAGCGVPSPSAPRPGPAAPPARTRRCAGSTTTPSPTTTTCSRTWPATPGPGSCCSARIARSTWAPTIRSGRYVRSGSATAEALVLGGNAGRLLGIPGG